MINEFKSKFLMLEQRHELVRLLKTWKPYNDPNFQINFDVIINNDLIENVRLYVNEDKVTMLSIGKRDFYVHVNDGSFRDKMAEGTGYNDIDGIREFVSSIGGSVET